MGIFDFFRKITKTENIQGIVIEKLSFSKIGDWIEKKTKENELKEKESILVIENKINDFIKELREKILVLEGVDVELKKEKDRIKNIVKEGRTEYIESLEELIERLNNLNSYKLEKFIEKINKVFLDFNKSSFKNYERATILIGKEMRSIKENLKDFSKNILKIFDEAKPLLDSSKNLLIIQEKLNTIVSINKILEGINEKKLNLSKKITEKEEESKILKQNLGEIKTSQSYLENFAKQKKIVSLQEESEKNILELKQLIDFKSLSNFFHTLPEQMNIVKEHKENFQINFERDNGKVMLELLDMAKLSNNMILEKVRQIRTQIEERVNHKRELKEDETQEAHFKIKETNLEIDNLKIENVKEEKREEKLKISKEELMKTLKQEFSKLNTEIV